MKVDLATVKNPEVMEIINRLMDLFDIPKDVIAFEVRFAVGETVKIKTEHHAKVKRNEG